MPRWDRSRLKQRRSFFEEVEGRAREPPAEMYNSFHVGIAVAVVGAAVTLGFAIWHSQKGKQQVPAIIANQHVLRGQR
jgi:hypothetical protein